MVAEELSYTKIAARHEEALQERLEWESEWRTISEYLLPGRGVYDTLDRPRKRQLTSSKVINTVAEDALYVLTSGMHGGLTSPSRPWFDNEWSDPRLRDNDYLVGWMQEATKRLHEAFHVSNFYSVINSIYTETAGFGNGSMYVGHDTGTDRVPFRFELLTAGEYAFTIGPDGRMDGFFRTVFMTPRNLVARFGSKASDDALRQVKENKSGADTVSVTVLEAVVKRPYRGMPYTRVFYEISGGKQNEEKQPLSVSGFHEFPYPVARWSIIGSDTYGIGPGSRALPDIKRLQEMEKAFLMATHKSINPPLNAPARMRGKLNTLPGGYNYYANPQEVVHEVYQIRFDYQGVGGAVERVEQRIQRNFFNDIFLTAARDPNATPYKATEVNAREQEKMLRLGPVIERFQHEFLQPVIERCFNIMLRKGLMPELDPQYDEVVGEYNINIISPLATAQRAIALQGINSFMGFIGNAAQFDPTILDNINVDEAARDIADISGVRMGILRPKEEVQVLRQQRAQAQAAQQQKEEAMVATEVGAKAGLQDAQSRKTAAEAGKTTLEAQQVARDIGMM